MPWPRVHDTRIVAAVIGSPAAVAWCMLWFGRDSAWGHALLHSQHALRMGISQPVLAGMFVLSWTLMTVAMMLPTSSPLILLFHRMVAARQPAHWLVVVLVAGYLVVWALFGVLTYLLNCSVEAVTVKIPWVAENPQIQAAAILMVAGIYQFSPLKYACLDKCRSPMLFLVERWRGKHPLFEAFRLGASHGIYCVGCCWSLMLVMFATSTGSLVWMLLLGAIMAAEKNFSWGRRLSVPVGLLLVVGAAVVVSQRWSI